MARCFVEYTPDLVRCIGAKSRAIIVAVIASDPIKARSGTDTLVGHFIAEAQYKISVQLPGISGTLAV
jgi:hypothetical protein